MRFKAPLVFFPLSPIALPTANIPLTRPSLTNAFESCGKSDFDVLNDNCYKSKGVVKYPIIDTRAHNVIEQSANCGSFRRVKLILIVSGQIQKE